jgi:hypothetical protein
LDRLKDDPWLLENLGDFDMNEDGEFDYIFLYYRALVDGNGAFLNGLAGLRWGGISELIPADSTIVVSNGTATLSIGIESGSMILPFSYDLFGSQTEVRTVMGLPVLRFAHEYGHDLWGDSH